MRGSGPLIIRQTWVVVVVVGSCVLAACVKGSSPEGSVSYGASSVCSPALPTLGPALERIDREVQAARRRESIPGVAAGVVCGDSLVWSRGYGVLAVDDSQPVTSSTRFRIASITKVFTATAVMKLWESGSLQLDDPVNRYLPWFHLQRTKETGNDPVTVRHLLTHTSGVPANSSLTNFTRLYQPARREAITALPAQQLESRPGTSYAYSNLGYGVLGDLVATVSGASYDAYLQREILQPLGMVETLVHPSPGEEHTAWGSGPIRRDGTRAKAGFWELGFFAPAGGMAASVVDLGRFIALQLAPYRGDTTTVLRPETLREMHRVHFALPSRSIDLGVQGVTGVGYAWAVDRSNGHHVVYHTGGLPEQTSYMMIDLGSQVGVVFLTNAQDAGRGVAEKMLKLVRAAIDTAPGG